MPIEILLEPLVKQIQVSEGTTYILNICDIEFIILASAQKTLKIKMAIQLFDLLSKIYLNDIIWANSVFNPIKVLISRFLTEEAFTEYILKLIKISLIFIQKSTVPNETQLKRKKT